MSGWIGCDFDGTLATSVTKDWWGPLGEPIPEMVGRVKNWIAQGIEVRIFTARVSQYDKNGYLKESEEVYHRIENWCEKYLGVVLEITSEKDDSLIEIWDDRAIQVIKDTGERVGNVNRGGE